MTTKLKSLAPRRAGWRGQSTVITWLLTRNPHICHAGAFSYEKPSCMSLAVMLTISIESLPPLLSAASRLSRQLSPSLCKLSSHVSPPTAPQCCRVRLRPPQRPSSPAHSYNPLSNYHLCAKVPSGRLSSWLGCRAIPSVQEQNRIRRRT